MSQRNPMNERYNDEQRKGQTRKSSASAKPKAQRAATVRDPLPKTKKQKKEEARERERKAAEKAQTMQVAFETTDTYKKLRRIWWVALIGAIACTALSFVVGNQGDLAPVSMALMITAYALIIGAFYIDLGKIRKERKLYNASVAANNSKEARREQKRLRAEKKAQEQEAAEKFEAAQAEKAAKAEQRKGFFSRFTKSKDDSATEEAEAKEAKAEAEPAK